MTDCDCPRCMTARYETKRRNTLDSMLWSGGLFRRYPSAVVPFAVLVILQVLFWWSSFPGSGAVVFLLLISARGYVDLCAVDNLLDADRGPLGRAWKVLRRLPTAVLARGLSVVAVFVAFGLPLVPLGIGSMFFSGFDLANTSLLFLALAGIAVVVVILISLTSAFVVYVKMVLVSEACFVSGTGVVGSLRESWRSVRLRRMKIVLLAGTFSVVAGFLVSGVLGIDGGGGENESFLRVASSAATTAFYAGLFTHLYVERRFEREKPVHSPSGGSTSTSS